MGGKQAKPPMSFAFESVNDLDDLTLQWGTTRFE